MAGLPVILAGLRRCGRIFAPFARVTLTARKNCGN
jgi:hypothetical protein